ncbi:substrate-binding domain-containing protein [Caldovatus aquaticus]|uniref:ABC transporter substrate-binding protein n=1 Tax=Caldovatus aquaticus TaxID=2865671 RepID=A0ABS7EXB8_9PROT|nr:ABC transporter substrate-binding protein [Caldovatus aquaticus]MBW8267908.1 ABC transporter substrate-binding protein [Caldovatus aquaticus]
MPTSLVLIEPFRALFYAPFYAAISRGEMARQGIALRLETAGDPAAAAAALLSGRADLAWSGPMRVIRERARPPRAPAQLLRRGDARPVPAGRPGAAAGGVPARDLPSLCLGTVAEVPTPWWCLQDDLRRLGVDPAAMPRRVGDRAMAENAAAVAEGRLDLAQLFEPHAALLEAQGGAVWHAQAGRGPTAYTALYATETTIAARRAAFEAAIRAMAATLAWIAAAPPAEIAATIAPWFPDVPPDALRAALARY